jgi:hypothetical protein
MNQEPMTIRSSKLARYAGLAAAICVPALVVAQQQTNPPTAPFADNDLLRASEVRQLRNALVEAIGRINTLEANTAGVAIAKGDVYSVAAESAPVAQNGTGTIEALCEDGNDVMLSCGCGGLNATAGTNDTQFDLRNIDLGQRVVGQAAGCLCQADNVGNNVARVLEATGLCLRVP